MGEAGIHAVVDAEIGSIRQGERELAEALTRSLEPDMIVLADRGFYSYNLWRSYLLAGPALLWRVSRTTHLPVLTVLPDGSYLSEIKNFKGPGKARIHIDQVADPMLATHITVRVIEYQVDTGDPSYPPKTYRLITTVLDPEVADAHTLAATYTQRWEFESSLREIECQLLEPGSTLRSKKPETGRQEIWGLLLTHYAIRAFMKEAADTTDLDPDRISTITAINIVRRSVTDPAAFSPRSTTTATTPSDQ